MSLPTREEYLRQLEEVQSDEECPICYEVAKVPVKSTCNHIFCRRCAKKCLASSDKCPYCRTKVSEDLDPDPAFMHVHLLGSDDGEDDFVTLDLRDIQQFTIGDKVIPPPFWVVCRRPALADEPPDRLRIVITANGVDRRAARDRDAAALAAATDSLAQLEVEGTDEAHTDETETEDTEDTPESDQDETDTEDGEEAPDEDNTDADLGYHETQYAWFTCERHNFHLDEDIDEDIAKTAMTYLWGCQDRDHSPDLDGQVLLDYDGLFPRAIGALLKIIPDRYIADDVEMPKWDEICLLDWKMAQYLEYKPQEMQDEKPQWQAREFKAELYKGWDTEMMENDSDDEESEDEQVDDETSDDQDTQGAETDQETDVKEEKKEADDEDKQGETVTVQSVTPETGHPCNIDENHSAKSSDGGDDIEDTNEDSVISPEVDNENDASSKSESVGIPRIPTYSARVVETSSKGCSFEQNVDQLFDLITYFAQEHYNGLPYENWGPDCQGVQEVDISYEEARVYRQSA